MRKNDYGTAQVEALPILRRQSASNWKAAEWLDLLLHFLLQLWHQEPCRLRSALARQQVCRPVSGCQAVERSR
nr:MAG TPA: hypothetical protein [Caudoviricetes sp.]